MRLMHWTTRLIRTAFAVALATSTVAMTRSEIADVQDKIEIAVKSLLAEQLAPGEFIAYAVVTPLDTGAAQGGVDNMLPYTSLNVPSNVLQEILEKNLPKDQLANLRIEVTLGLDERLPEEKRRLLEDVVRKRFGFDGEQRVLTVQTLKLVTPRIADAERVEIERLRAQSEQASLRLAAERSQLEVKQKDIEIATLQQQAVQAAAAQPPATATASAQILAPPGPAQGLGPDVQAQAPMQLGPQLALFKDFQLTAMALVLGIVLVVAIMVGGSFFIKGLTPLSSAIETVGASIEVAAKTAGGGSTSVTTITEGGDGKGEGQGEGGDGRAGGIGGQPVFVSESASKANAEFQKQV